MRTFRKLLTVSFSGLQRCHYQTRSPLSLKSVFDHQTRSPFRGVEGMGLSKSLTFSNLRDSDPPSKSLTFTAQSVYQYQTRSPLGAMGLFHHQSRSPFDDFPIGLSKSLTFRPMRETSESVFWWFWRFFFSKNTPFGPVLRARAALWRGVFVYYSLKQQQFTGLENAFKSST